MRRPILKLFLLAAGVAVIALAVTEGLHWWRHVYEPNATIKADFTVLTSSVNATIESINVRKGDRVAKRAPLATMDAAVAALDTDSLAVDLEKEKAVRAQIEAELATFRIELADKIATNRALITLQEREAETLARRRRIARDSVDRNAALLKRKVISRRVADDAIDKLLDITSKLRELRTDIAVHERKVAELEGSRKRETVYLSRLAVVDRNVERIAVRLEQSRKRLRDMHIYAPIDGVINEVYVNPGAYVEDGDKVFLIHDPTRLWIEADIDEADIRHVAIGQDVVIDIDAYPYEHFTGRVRSIGHVTLRSMATNGAIDARSAQKIPVIIDLPAIDKTIWPGMRAAVNIRIR